MCDCSVVRICPFVLTTTPKVICQASGVCGVRRSGLKSARTTNFQSFVARLSVLWGSPIPAKVGILRSYACIG